MRAVWMLLASAIAAAAPAVAEACTVSRPLPSAELEQRAEAEGAAWRGAPLVYVARITATGRQYESFTLTPVRILKGSSMPGALTVPPEPSVRMCLIYHGLSVEYGASMGDEFVVYSWDTEPRPDSRLLIVSTRMLRDPATRAALEVEP